MISFVLKKGAAICLSFFYFSTLTSADESAFLELGLSLDRVNYQEKNHSAFQLNQESGWLPGVFARAGLGYDDLSLYSEARVLKSDIGYDGHTQALQALSTSTDTTRSELAIGAAYWPHSWFGLSVQASQYYWDRQIGATHQSLPLDEIYRWRSISLSAELMLFNRSYDQLSLEISEGRFSDEVLEVDLSRLGYGKPEIRLDGRRYRGFELKYLYHLNSELDLTLNAAYSQLYFNESQAISVNNGATVITIREPKSETGLVQLNLGLRFKI